MTPGSPQLQNILAIFHDSRISLQGSIKEALSNWTKNHHQTSAGSIMLRLHEETKWKSLLLTSRRLCVLKVWPKYDNIVIYVHVLVIITAGFFLMSITLDPLNTGGKCYSYITNTESGTNEWPHIPEESVVLNGTFPKMFASSWCGQLITIFLSLVLQEQKKKTVTIWDGEF